ncbi:Variant surface glycoprotein [Trypanosoma congolense IL3000]|uniref:Variant surface glycoprotein n=1 Tax=Trypanosoma congolense (strain IL3000) TaxID=1068625 RepID=F9WD85_TRYCI|nr:Variant surface glycoprotein [Trypanosoma congolense IL3000]
MKIWMVMMVFFGVVASADEKDHNGAQHQALCDLMKAAVGKWGSSGEGLSEPLKKALHQTIFGNESGGSLETLRNGLPKDYEEVLKQSDSRNFACGQHYNDPTELGRVHQVLRSGQSAPHDLVCLCTVGDGGWPLNISDSEKLCGLDKSSLGGGSEGWGDESHETKVGKKQITATWNKVTTPCLKEGQGGDLKKALHNLINKLVNTSVVWYPSRFQLGEGEPSDDFACTGSPKRGVCVEYYNSTTTLYPLPWWSELEKAIQKDKEIQEQKKRDEEEKRKQQDEAEQQNSQKPETLKSGPQTNNQTEQPKKDNLTDKLRRYNLTSGTPTSLPSSWLLSAILLI